MVDPSPAIASTPPSPPVKCRMAHVVVEELTHRFSVAPEDAVEVTDVAISEALPKMSFWCRFEIRRANGLLVTGALLAWFLDADLPPVLQFFTAAVL